MKKIIATLILISAMLIMTSCSSSSESIVNESTIEENDASTRVFGKVKNVVGNEIELEIADMPFDTDMEASGSSSDIEAKEFVYEWKGEEELPEGVDSSEGSFSSTIIAISGENGEMQIIGGEDGAKMDLKYTGESTSVIIPTGTEILNMLGSGTLEDIKKGSVLMISVEDENASTLKANSILIME